MTDRFESTPGVFDEIDLSSIRELRNVLYAHGMRPNKSFGQNFLIDRSVLAKIVEAAEISASDEILEVGAGTGVLTRELAKNARRVVAVELERDMLALLAETTRTYKNVELLARNNLPSLTAEGNYDPSPEGPKAVFSFSTQLRSLERRHINSWRICHIILLLPRFAISWKAPIRRACSW